MRVVFVPQAQDEILEAAAYYRERSVEAANRFSSNLSALIELLQKFPRIGTPVAYEVRRVILKKFPYQLIYRIEGDEIRIYAVAHLKRKPRYWIDRLPQD